MFTVIAILLLVDILPSKRIIGILFLSVSLITLLYINHFNDSIFAILGILFIYIENGLSLQKE